MATKLKEDVRVAAREEKQKRADECAKELDELLKKHGCVLKPVMQFLSENIVTVARFKIVALD